MNNMTKKQFAEIICKTFNLKGITSNSFVYVAEMRIKYISPFSLFGKQLSKNA